jgi:hypothetical protein
VNNSPSNLIPNRESGDVSGRRISVVVIGRQSGVAFNGLSAFLIGSPDLQIVGGYPTISEGLQDGLGESKTADLVVVLQNTSEEFSPVEVNQLIGRMLFGRILCCYGPWCLADGRAHDIWPVSIRVPVESAEEVIGQELRAIRQGQAALFPMSAAEEVFSCRVAQGIGRSTLMSPGTANSGMMSRGIVIVSDELPLRRTISMFCRELGLQPVESRLDVLNVVHEMKRLLKLRGGDAFALSVLVDVDPPDRTCVELVSVLVAQFSGCRIWGLSVFAELPPALASSQSASRMLTGLIQKTELEAQLNQCLLQNGGHG